MPQMRLSSQSRGSPDHNLIEHRIHDPLELVDHKYCWSESTMLDYISVNLIMMDHSHFYSP